MDSSTSSSSSSRGFTLIEAVFSVLIVGVMLVAVLATVGAVARSHVMRERQRLADALARSLLTEVISLPLDDPNDLPVLGIELSELLFTTRGDFDDIDDFDNWRESPPRRRNGSAITDLSGWERSVDVVFVNPRTLAPSAARTALARITVTVESPDGHTRTIEALRAKPLGPASGDGRGVEWVGIELTPSGARRTLYSGVRTVNRPTP